MNIVLGWQAEDGEISQVSIGILLEDGSNDLCACQTTLMEFVE